MFRRRLKFCLLLVAVVMLVLLGRLAALQLGPAHDNYVKAVEQMKLKAAVPIPSIRGRIYAQAPRHGAEKRLLVSEGPAFQVEVDYRLLSQDQEWIDARASRQVPRHAENKEQLMEQARHDVERQLDELWDLIARATDRSRHEIDQRRQDVTSNVERLWRYLARRNNYDPTNPEDRTLFVIAEQVARHPVAGNLTEREAIQARLILKDHPWFSSSRPYVTVEAGTRRVYHYPGLAVHLLGRAVPASTVAWRDADDDDPPDYLPDELRGISGIEQAWDSTLHGQHGVVQENRLGELVRLDDPVAGEDIVLTLDVPLQQYIESLLQWRVAELGDPKGEDHPVAGAAAVVLSVPDRKLLAAVSYPTYRPEHFSTLFSDRTRTFDPDEYAERREELLEAWRWWPTLDRTMGVAYHPGSTVKPSLLLAGLATGLRTVGSTEYCMGRLQEAKAGFRCHGTHYEVNGYKAVKYSCDVYFYKLGASLGVDNISRWLYSFGFGRQVGTGLLPYEERVGRLAGDWWWGLTGNDPVRLYLADSWTMGIGQGRMDVTVLQAASMAGTLAAGDFRPVTLAYRDGEQLSAKPADSDSLLATAQPYHWQEARKAMWAVVNERGTGRRVQLDEVEVAGKTGTAQTSRRILCWQVRYRDSEGEEHEAVTADLYGLTRRLRDDDSTTSEVLGSTVLEMWPPDRFEQHYDKGDHAWFIGYAPYRSPKIAFAVFMEFGGHGGSSCGPVAREIVAKCCELGYIDARDVKAQVFDEEDGG